MINKYLERYAYTDQQIFAERDALLNLVIVIPARVESALLITLESILDAEPPQKPYEVLVVFNHPLGEKEELKIENERLFQEGLKYLNERLIKHIHFIKAFDLPDKHAGVGLARKIGMDEAVRRLGSNSKGLIVALDADCRVSNNYLRAIENYFDDHPSCDGASIYFEHPLNELDEHLLSGIINYELHLRYYNQLLKYAGHPFAFHTVGSSMAVRSGIYQKQGGMNKRKAGEDFYFLQKVIQLGNFGEIKDAIVYPSARVSDRVPFGTGRAMAEWKKNKEDVFVSYHPEMATDLKDLFYLIVKEGANDTLFDRLPERIKEFIGEAVWEQKMNELSTNTITKTAFIQRFFQWFNLFMCFKFAHFYRDRYRANIPVYEGATILLEKLDLQLSGKESLVDLLKKFRKLEMT